MLSGEAANTSVIVFGLNWPNLEPVIYHNLVKHDNRYPTDMVFNFCLWFHRMNAYNILEYSIITWCFSYWPSYRSEGQYEKHHVMIPLLINQSNISRDFSLQFFEMSSGFRSSCYWTDWNWANTENIHIGLIFPVLTQWKFLYCIDRFDHIKANKSKLINNIWNYIPNSFNLRIRNKNIDI